MNARARQLEADEAIAEAATAAGEYLTFERESHHQRGETLMHDHRGWIGSALELDNTLRCNRCDTTPDGKFCVRGSITSFMGGGEEFVVGADAVYYVGGEPKHLVTALAATTYGQVVTVI